MILATLFFIVVVIAALYAGWFVYNLEQGFINWLFGQSHSAVMAKGVIVFCVLIAGLMLVGYLESWENSL